MTGRDSDRWTTALPARRLRLATRGAGIVLVALATATACSVLPGQDAGSGSGSASSTTPGPVGLPAGANPDLSSFYSQSLSWSSCTGGECAKLTVPIDYAHPSAGSIQLAVLRVKARDQSKRLGSLVVNPGGPGGSGVQYAQAANQIVGPQVRAQYDVVGFDPRGVGQSAPIMCFDNGQMDQMLGSDPTPDTPVEEQALVTEDKQFADACQAKNTALLPHVGTEDAARDMDVLRSALGDQQLNFLGKSYGTFLGATYAGLFPKLVGRFVLDGVVPPELSSQQINEGQAGGFETATRAYVASCVAKSGCPLGTNVDDGLKALSALMTGLDSKPLPVTNDAKVKQLTEGWGTMGVAVAMYDQGYWTKLTQALKDAKNGDGNGLMALANLYADRSSSGSYDGNMLQVISAVNCLDRPDTADLATVEANVKTFQQISPTWGAMMAWGSVGCGVWPVKGTNPPHTISAEGSNLIVVVGTTRDPATPYQWSKDLRGQLANAALISYDGDGHTAYRRSNSCVDNAIDAYYVQGTAPKDGLTC